MADPIGAAKLPVLARETDISESNVPRFGGHGVPQAGGDRFVPLAVELEEAGMRVVEAAHLVVVEDDAANTAVLGEGSRLRFDLLRREHA